MTERKHSVRVDEGDSTAAMVKPPVSRTAIASEARTSEGRASVARPVASTPSTPNTPLPISPPPIPQRPAPKLGSGAHAPALPVAILHTPQPAPTPLSGRIPTPESIRTQTPIQTPVRVSDFHLSRTRSYAFALDAAGRPIEIGSGRYAKVFLGEERWLESLTDVRRPVVIKMLQRNVGGDDARRFRMEKELLERVQGHPSIVELLASGHIDDPGVPAGVREQCEGDFMILERLDMNLEERIKGSRSPAAKEDLLALDMHDRLLRVLEYMIPVASAVEYAHLVKNVCHRDIKPANILVGLRDTRLAGSTLQVRLADFNVAKILDRDPQMGVTRFAHGVPGTMYFQSPEQETNVLELLVNVEQGSTEIEYFEDFYINVAKNDSFALFNRNREYPVLYTDRARKRIVLKSAYLDPSETNIRARVQKSVGRPADIYSLGALFYYLVTGAYGNPKALYDAFHKFVEYERTDDSNTIEAYLQHEYATIKDVRSPAKAGDDRTNVAPADRFFSYKHYTDGNGELIDPAVMTVIARCMIRNKPDSYCQAWDLETAGITKMVRELTNLYSLFGFQAGTIPTSLPGATKGAGRKRALALAGAQAQGMLRQLVESLPRR
jgi:serine/threonine protein kinase